MEAVTDSGEIGTGQPAGSTPPLPISLLRAMRPKQWTKNGAVFMAAVFTVNLYWRPGDIASLLSVFGLSFAAFVIFSGLSSAVYLINDVTDFERDRLHPKKSRRPIAAGLVSPRLAIATATVLLLISLPLSFVLEPGFGLVAVLYVLSQLLYSFYLKHEVILDVFTIAAGFALRVVGGGLAISVPISPWLYVCTILGALFLALAKRRNELTLLEGTAIDHRRSLQEYSASFLDQMIGVVTSSTVIAYSLYTFSAENLPANHAMMLTIPFVLYGLFRYLYLVYMRGRGGSPDEALLSDRPLLMTAVLWVFLSLVVLYFARH